MQYISVCVFVCRLNILVFQYIVDVVVIFDYYDSLYFQERTLFFLYDDVAYC